MYLIFFLAQKEFKTKYRDFHSMDSYRFIFGLGFLPDTIRFIIISSIAAYYPAVRVAFLYINNDLSVSCSSSYRVQLEKSD
ncbi:hypothetical protein GCM10026983_15140 [Gracilibacillus alcaliphilus]